MADLKGYSVAEINAIIDNYLSERNITSNMETLEASVSYINTNVNKLLLKFGITDVPDANSSSSDSSDEIPSNYNPNSYTYSEGSTLITPNMFNKTNSSIFTINANAYDYSEVMTVDQTELLNRSYISYAYITYTNYTYDTAYNINVTIFADDYFNSPERYTYLDCRTPDSTYVKFLKPNITNSGKYWTINTTAYLTGGNAYAYICYNTYHSYIRAELFNKTGYSNVGFTERYHSRNYVSYYDIDISSYNPLLILNSETGALTDGDVDSLYKTTKNSSNYLDSVTQRKLNADNTYTYVVTYSWSEVLSNYGTAKTTMAHHIDYTYTTRTTYTVPALTYDFIGYYGIRLDKAWLMTDMDVYLNLTTYNTSPKHTNVYWNSESESWRYISGSTYTHIKVPIGKNAKLLKGNVSYTIGSIDCSETFGQGEASISWSEIDYAGIKYGYFTGKIPLINGTDISYFEPQYEDDNYTYQFGYIAISTWLSKRGWYTGNYNPESFIYDVKLSIANRANTESAYYTNMYGQTILTYNTIGYLSYTLYENHETKISYDTVSSVEITSQN